MSIYEIYMKFTNPDGSIEYVSVYQYYSEHQDTYQGELCERMYRQVSLGVFAPI